MIPAEFDYVVPESTRRGAGRAARRRRGREAPRRRPLAAAADEAAAGGADAAGGPAPDRRADRHRARERDRPHRRHDDPSPGGDRRPGPGLDGRGDDRRPAGAQPRDAGRLARPRRPGLGHAGGPAGDRGVGVRDQRGRLARHRGRRPVPGLPDDRDRRGRDRHERSTSRSWTATGSATRSSTAAARTGRWSPSRRWSRRRATARARTCASASPTWATCRCGRPRPSRRCAARALDASSIAAAAEQAAEGTEPARRPQRHGRLQAPPRTRPVPAGARGGGGVAALGSTDDVTQTLAGEGYLADRGLATAVYLAATLEQPLLLEGEAGVGKTEVARALAAATGARADPAAVPRGHRPPPRGLRLGLRPPAALDPRRGGRG